MNNLGNTNLQLTNVHENKAKYVHKIEGCGGRKSCLYIGGDFSSVSDLSCVYDGIAVNTQ